MSRFRYVDPWSPDDPAQLRMREALALQPTEEPGEPKVAADATADAPLDPATRRARVAELKPLAEAGDRSALAALRMLLLGR